VIEAFSTTFFLSFRPPQQSYIFLFIERSHLYLFFSPPLSGVSSEAFFFFPPSIQFPGSCLLFPRVSKPSTLLFPFSPLSQRCNPPSFLPPPLEKSYCVLLSFLLKGQDGLFSFLPRLEESALSSFFSSFPLRDRLQS